MSSLKLIFGAALFSMSFLNPQEVQGVLNSLKESHITHPDTAGDIPRLLPGAPGSLSERLKPQGFTIDTKILMQAVNQGGHMERSAVVRLVETSLRRMGVDQVRCLCMSEGT